ncbi:dna mismatch repair proteins mutl / hexb / pms1 signature [Lucifera butyrica]|uniref:DNA mismatch repair protein MutL n=1 Tax=Lucifera butyrica TaxID=1351585 RepID=A0A498R0G2_9FIRM|nr:DNA mismatch repair endonuclease MutL [Lucifera butyrica]VBB05996.1 dna mismatch repair proteins mutl / hexb / pms1 signature [Lucifera butyrica]
MSPSVIRILDENTANKIAAGEVVERPASIIKELVENAIDAGSRNIEVEIAEGGTAFIRVTDDGSGMSQEDAQLAILRHATSKIRSAEDLGRIASLGFRGEALPSIASVSKFSITTRLHDATLATYVEVEGGVVTEVREAGGNAGTTVTVRDLFYNTPARQKFLKSPASESSHIHDILGKLALSHPEIIFRLINNTRVVLSTPGNGKLADALAGLHGYKVATDILPVNYTLDSIRVSGFVGKPTLLKSSRQWQTFLVDSRVINSRLIAKALDNAYHSLLPKNGYPLAVLNIEIPPDLIDVNVHPQKSEIKFSNEQTIYRAVYHAIVEVLADKHSPGELAASFPVKQPNNHYSVGRQSFEIPRAIPSTPSAPPSSWREEPLSFPETQQVIREEKLLPSTGPVPVDADIEATPEPDIILRPLGQIENCYIVAQGDDGLYIIDQHAAHERILYDRLGRTTDRIPAQQLLVPLFLEFDPQETNIILEKADTFYQLGFTLELSGPNTFRLLEMPSDISQTEADEALRQILSLLHNLHNPTPQDIRHAYLQTAACRAAVKAGEMLNMRQMQALISELCATTLPYTCPHGRPAMVRFAPEDLAKLFKRT